MSRAPDDPASAVREVEGGLGDPALRVVIAEDSLLFREGVVGVLRRAGFDVVGEAGDAAELLRIARDEQPDVCVIDVRLPPTHTDEGPRAALELRERYPDVSILLLSQVIEAKSAFRLFKEQPEGFGYLLKDRVLDLEEFVAGVRRVARGGTAVDPEVVAELLGRPRNDSPLAELTPREREVLSLMAEGRSNQGICTKLYLSPKTVESHVARIFGKLHLPQAPDDHRRVLAVLAFLGA
jgi:DNA-binding NarL/FixJ family response regulator